MWIVRSVENELILPNLFEWKAISLSLISLNIQVGKQVSAIGCLADLYTNSSYF